MSEEQQNNDLGIDISPLDPGYAAGLKKKLKEATEQLSKENSKDVMLSEEEKSPECS